MNSSHPSPKFQNNRVEFPWILQGLHKIKGPMELSEDQILFQEQKDISCKTVPLKILF